MYVNISTVVFLKGSTNRKNVNKIYRTNHLYKLTFTEYVLNYRSLMCVSCSFRFKPLSHPGRIKLIKKEITPVQHRRLIKLIFSKGNVSTRGNESI